MTSDRILDQLIKDLHRAIGESDTDSLPAEIHRCIGRSRLAMAQMNREAQANKEITTALKAHQSLLHAFSLNEWDSGTPEE